MEQNNNYRFLVNLNPQNPLDKKFIESINDIRKLHMINKRQMLCALLSIYGYIADSGVQDPFGRSYKILPKDSKGRAESAQRLPEKGGTTEEAEAASEEVEFDPNLSGEGFDTFPPYFYSERRKS